MSAKKTVCRCWQASGLYRLHARERIASTTADGFKCLM